jgi:hypothetical protein
MTKREWVLAGMLGLSGLALIDCLIVFTSRPARPKPIVMTRRPQTDLTQPKERSEVRHKTVRLGAARPPDIVTSDTAAPIAPASASPAEGSVMEDDEVAIPVAFFDPPPELTERDEQLAEFDSMRQQFIEAMGGPNRDPATPDYRRHWQEAQRLIDEQFSAFFGTDAFSRQQIRAIRAGARTPGSL